MTGCGGSGNKKGSGDNKNGNKVFEPGITMAIKINGVAEVNLISPEPANIDWGDGSPVEIAECAGYVFVTFSHSYQKEGDYNVKITGEKIESFGVENLTVTDLEINLPNLTDLYCKSKVLSELELGYCPELKVLNCETCVKLKSLDTSKNPKLNSINISDSGVSDFDFGKVPLLYSISCSRCNLTTLDLSKNPELQSLVCKGNQLTGLDLSKNPLLKNVYIGENEMSAEVLNAVFISLHDNAKPDENIIYIADNPGIKECDKKIAENKGWKVVDW